MKLKAVITFSKTLLYSLNIHSPTILSTIAQLAHKEVFKKMNLSFTDNNSNQI